MNATAGGGTVPGEIPVTEPPAARHETPPPAVVLALTLQRLAAFGVARWAAVLVDEGATV